MLRIPVLLFFTLLSAYSFSQTTAQSKRVTTSVTVDGNAKEWQNPFGLYESKTKLMFAIANNDSNLYLCFQCPDPVNQDKIMQAGMQVSIIRKGKNKLNASIEFPLKKTEKGENNEETYSGQQRTIPEIKADFLLNNFTMLTSGFATQNNVFNIKENPGIQVAINWDNINTLVYEIAIPLKELFGNGFTAADLGSELMLGVEIFAVSRPGIENYNINGLDNNNGASVVNGGAMQQYGTQNNYNNGTMNGMTMQNGYPANGMAGMNGAQNANWDGSAPPQYQDISGMFEKTEMKQKFLLSLTP